MPTIEFITVSRTPDRVKLLAQSIGLAMGEVYPHALRVVDGNRFDLFAGYNLAVSQSTAEILIFVHDDVQFLANPLMFEKPFERLGQLSTGFIGALGARMLNAAGTWWGGDLTKTQAISNCRGMINHVAGNRFGMRSVIWPGGTAEFGQVMVVDGVLLMCHRRTLNRLNGFDDKTYKGFHFYDVDTTFRAHQLGLKNYAAPLPMLHQSTGEYDEKWEKNRAIFANKYKGLLPCSL